MNLRESVLVQRDAIGAADLQVLLQFLKSAEMDDSLVSNFADDAPEDSVQWVVNKEVRNTQEVRLTESVRALLRRIDDRSIAKFINPFFGVDVAEREPSQVLHYGPGGHYIPHVDSETLYKDDDGLDIWEKTLERDLSVVYFLNQDFEGGELIFPELELTIKPETATLVCFPSDHNFIHGVKPVSSGRRFTLVNWFKVAGIPDLEAINRETMNEYHRQWPKQISQPPRIVKR